MDECSAAVCAFVECGELFTDEEWDEDGEEFWLFDGYWFVEHEGELCFCDPSGSDGWVWLVIEVGWFCHCDWEFCED